LRGRRRVGKSRLAQVFCERAQVPSVFFQASQGTDAATERAAFATAVRESDLPDRELFAPGVTFPDWATFLRLLAAALPTESPSVVVVDEFPWLMESDPTLEGILQTVWDTALAKKPVLLVLIGSDLAMMERLDDYKRPFHQRGTVMVLPPLSPAEVGSMLDLKPAEAFDAFLLTGGLPLICQEWRAGQSVEGFLGESLSDPTSALLVSGERSLAAEFPSHLQAKSGLTAIGHGERTLISIRNRTSGGHAPMAASSLTNALRLLEEKRVVAVDTPLATTPSKERRYRVADPYLRFYLAYMQAAIPLIERGRPDLALERVQGSWTSWRGRAIEPVIREALFRLAPEFGWPEVEAVGGWWNRQNNPEIDLVGADRGPVASRIFFVGSIKWHETRPFDRHDHAALIRGLASVHGADDTTELVAVSRSATTDDVPLRSISPKELIRAWNPGG
jgi:uncharacterized protein